MEISCGSYSPFMWHCMASTQGKQYDRERVALAKEEISDKSIKVPLHGSVNSEFAVFHSQKKVRWKKYFFSKRYIKFFSPNTSKYFFLNPA